MSPSLDTVEKAASIEPLVLESSLMEITSKSDSTRAALPIDPSLERKLLWKLDLRIVPILWLLFLVSFFDRSNIGNAKIAGMTQSLHMKGNDYNIAVTVFTVAYVVFGMPANLLVKKFGPKILAVFMFCWGEWRERERLIS
jgi:fucose permease